jgi:hypothetical protein
LAETLFRAAATRLSSMRSIYCIDYEDVEQSERRC